MNDVEICGGTVMNSIIISGTSDRSHESPDCRQWSQEIGYLPFQVVKPSNHHKGLVLSQWGLVELIKTWMKESVC